MSEQDASVTALNRLQHWATRSWSRFAIVAGLPVTVVLAVAAVAAGLVPGPAAAVAVGPGLFVASRSHSRPDSSC